MQLLEATTMHHSIDSIFSGEYTIYDHRCTKKKKKHHTDALSYNMKMNLYASPKIITISHLCIKAIIYAPTAIRLTSVAFI